MRGRERFEHFMKREGHTAFLSALSNMELFSKSWLTFRYFLTAKSKHTNCQGAVMASTRATAQRLPLSGKCANRTLVFRTTTTGMLEMFPDWEESVLISQISILRKGTLISVCDGMNDPWRFKQLCEGSFLMRAYWRGVKFQTPTAAPGCRKTPFPVLSLDQGVVVTFRRAYVPTLT